MVLQNCQVMGLLDMNRDKALCEKGLRIKVSFVFGIIKPTVAGISDDAVKEENFKMPQRGSRTLNR